MADNGHKISNVKRILAVREWTGGDRTVFYHKLEMENGDIGTIGKQKKDAFKIGDSLTYTTKETDRGIDFKEVRPNFHGNGARPPENLAAIALTCATSITTGLLAAGKTNDLKSSKLAEVTCLTANVLLKWLKENL